MGVLFCVSTIAESRIIDKICLINFKGNNFYVTEFVFVSLFYFAAPLTFFSKCQVHGPDFGQVNFIGFQGEGSLQLPRLFLIGPLMVRKSC